MRVAKGKLKLLYLLDILRRHTDEEHPLSSRELCSLLEQRGIEAERKSIYRDIAVLNECGLEIGSTRFPKPGYFLLKRDFELPEVRLLIDAVLAAPFITRKKTAGLVEKLKSLASLPQSQGLEPQIFADQRVKFDNEEIYYSIDAVHTAISAGKKVRFRYYHRVIRSCRAEWNEGREFTVSPYALLWANDKYYVAGNYEKYGTVGNYRIDRMKHVSVTDLPIRPFSEVSDYRERFDAADYLKKSFYMYRGEPQEIELCCTNDMLEAVLDKFGADVDFVYQDEDQFTFRAPVYVSDGLVEWILQYGGRVRVLRPDSLYEKTAEKIRALCSAYRIRQG